MTEMTASSQTAVISVSLVWMILGCSYGQDHFEAAFQGQCNVKGTEMPCQHICRNHSPRTFECSCRNGFQLDHNGYSCSPFLPPDTRPTNRSNLEHLQSAAADQSTNLLYPANHVPYIPPESTESPCSGQSCLGGGLCASDRIHGYRCLCPLGRRGIHCEERTSFTIPRFSGDSYALLPLSTDWDLEFGFQIEFHAEKENGVVLYSGENLTASKNFLALELVDGYITFRLKISRTSVSLTSRYKVPLGDNVMVKAGRLKGDFYLRVASEDRIVTTIQDVADLDVKATENIYLGGLPDFDRLEDGTVISRVGFAGCILSLSINQKKFVLEILPFGSIIHGINIDRCSDSYTCQDIQCLNDGLCVIDHQTNKPKCDCPVTFVGERCETDLQLEIPFFNASSFLIFPVANSSVLHVTNFLLTFRPSDISSGVLMYMGLPNNIIFTDGMQLRLSRGFVELVLDLGEGPTVTRIPTKLVINQWYQVALKRTGRLVELMLDGPERTTITYTTGAFTELNVDGRFLYIGGIDYWEPAEDYASYRGCIDLNKSEFMGSKLILSRALSASNLDTCRVT